MQLDAQTCMFWLTQEYKAHGRSREAIEMAFDEILKQKMKVRHKYGFRPPKTGRRTDMEGEPTVSVLSRNDTGRADT